MANTQKTSSSDRTEAQGPPLRKGLHCLWGGLGAEEDVAMKAAWLRADEKW